MWLKLSIITLLFFCLELVQNSFLPHWHIMVITPNLVFILFFIIIFFEKPNQYSVGFFSIVVAGFLLDAFSSFYFGASIMSLLIIYGLFKVTLHFLKEIQGRYIFIYFISLFLVFLITYNVLFYVFTNFPHVTFDMNVNIFAGLTYNLIFAILVFYIYKSFINENNKDRQLTLFR